ncbi:hypothetical protein C8Q75DRAFT_138344 [Abortiporus biennis]|nr:hypothetical protein C8Q75DRAFT_138344 [Abortiporus biennis]
MLFRRSRGFPDLVYVAARLSCLSYVISDLLFDILVFIRANTLGSNLCLISEVSEWSSVPFIVVAVHDTMVFLAISIRLTYLSHVGCDANGRFRWRTFLRGSSMPSLSRALLKNGQLYYLVTIGFSVACGFEIMITSIPVSYRN